MKKFNYSSILFMLVITIIFTSALATIHQLTKDQVQLNEELKEHKSMLYVLDIPFENKTAIEVSNIRTNYIKEIKKESLIYYEGFKGDTLIGYIFPIEGDAVWGYLRGFISLSPDLTEIIGVDFLSHNETPGLGGRIDELQFKQQFRGIQIDPDQEDENYIIYKPNPNGQVDAISGATGTSDAVKRIINKKLESILMEMKGGDN